MKAIRVHEFGGPQVLKVEHDVPVPVHTDSQVLINTNSFNRFQLTIDFSTKWFLLKVLIRVGSAGVNPVDTYIRMGLFAQLPSLPYIPGRDGAGTVEKVGSQVDTLKVIQLVPMNPNWCEFVRAIIMFQTILHTSWSLMTTIIRSCYVGIRLETVFSSRAPAVRTPSTWLVNRILCSTWPTASPSLKALL